MDYNGLTVVFSIIAMLLSSAVHEYAHAYAAYKLGDDTAKAEGRMTMNPLAHIDPIGFLMMLFARIGWSKPVPVNAYNFEDRKMGSAIVAVAGPVSNLILALLSALSLVLLGFIPLPVIVTQFLASFITVMLFINVSLMFFNLIPIPPLDGSHIVELFIPRHLEDKWDDIAKYTPYIFLLLFLPITPLFTFFNIFWYNLLFTTVNLILGLFGLPVVL